MRPLTDISSCPSSSPTRPRTVEPTLSGLESLADLELLCLVLDRVPGVIPVRTLASDLMDRFGSLGAIAAADVPEPARVQGAGPAVIMELKLLRQLATRLARHAASGRPVLSSWEALRAYAVTALAHLPREQFRALYLDRRNRLVRDELVADGSVDHAPVYPREVVRRALELSASAIILIHNHPSGDPSPSRADIEMTKKVVAAARVFDLPVHDHLIVGRAGTASLRSLGLMS
ncbi:RadC family protein [Brevundimonas variabilis]|uniref:DNA repair protein RadC n=1 Tax=Brevundimonas variabilis TaxID=74312 RepID=A0A7W9CHE2_9CAUL|nr:DNA repair protein RadC [Brevundimonas variabilis]MBB5745687.1 DNA repair protein RadC [Brevundimonas variabilis]